MLEFPYRICSWNLLLNAINPLYLLLDRIWCRIWCFLIRHAPSFLCTHNSHHNNNFPTKKKKGEIKKVSFCRRSKTFVMNEHGHGEQFRMRKYAKKKKPYIREMNSQAVCITKFFSCEDQKTKHGQEMTMQTLKESHNALTRKHFIFYFYVLKRIFHK